MCVGVAVMANTYWTTKGGEALYWHGWALQWQHDTNRWWVWSLDCRKPRASQGRLSLKIQSRILRILSPIGIGSPHTGVIRDRVLRSSSRAREAIIHGKNGMSRTFFGQLRFPHQNTSRYFRPLTR